MACKTISFFFCFLFISIDSISYQQLSDTETDCSKRWIHIRRLPSRFNLDLLTNCSEYPLFDNFCPYLANHGLGPKTHDKSQSWYRSNPLLLELIFHRRMLEYPCLTSDPNQANAIYLPYYAAIDSLRYLYGPGFNNRSMGLNCMIICKTMKVGYGQGITGLIISWSCQGLLWISLNL
jgi:hypothetical protein